MRKLLSAPSAAERNLLELATKEKLHAQKGQHTHKHTYIYVYIKQELFSFVLRTVLSSSSTRTAGEQHEQWAASPSGRCCPFSACWQTSWNMSAVDIFFQIELLKISTQLSPLSLLPPSSFSFSLCFLMAFYYLPLLFVFFLFSMCIFVVALHCSALLCVYWISLLTRRLPCFLCPFAILSLLFPFSVSPLPVRYFWQLLCVCLKAWKAIVATVGILSIVCVSVSVCVTVCVSVCSRQW